MKALKGTMGKMVQFTIIILK